jgi:hypothetical protein
MAHSVAAFTASLNTISGSVYRLDSTPIEGVTVKVTDAQVAGVTDPNGHYEVPVVHKWSGKIQPEKVGYLFGPTVREYSEVNDNLVAQDFADVSIYDIDDSGAIDWGDFYILCDSWLQTGEDIAGDFYKDENNIVDFLDFADFVRAWRD